jgi:hypothetical protein
MSTFDSENAGKPAARGCAADGRTQTRQDGQATRKCGRGRKPAAKPKADRTNKKAEVIAMMKRSKGATLPEIMKVTGKPRKADAQKKLPAPKFTGAR